MFAFFAWVFLAVLWVLVTSIHVYRLKWRLERRARELGVALPYRDGAQFSVQIQWQVEDFFLPGAPSEITAQKEQIVGWYARACRYGLRASLLYLALLLPVEMVCWLA
ncbi:MAG: hypothetical protein Q7P63_11330 [Verrucomicrobiota bacterium JB022]|nr:hypothetical protein [Verrucomicrobiota bacterium JB022]